MSRTPSALPTAAPAPWTAPVLDAEKLDVFHVSVEFHGLVPQLARRAPRDRAHFFAIARGSAAESAAVVHLLLSRGLVAEPDARCARSLLIRIVSMRTRLEQRFRQRA